MAKADVSKQWALKNVNGVINDYVDVAAGDVDRLTKLGFICKDKPDDVEEVVPEAEPESSSEDINAADA